MKKRNIKKSPSNVQNLDALHPERVQANMPDAQETQKELDRLASLADTTKRAGAGGVIPGQVGLRLSGASAFNEFHERYTETGKVPKKEKPVFDLRAQGQKYEGPRFKVVEIPFQLCCYCLKKVINPNTPNYMLNFQPIVPDNIEMFRPVGLLPGDVIRHAICKDCKKTMKSDFNSELQVMHNGEMIPQKYLKAAEHAKRLQENLVLILRQSPLNEVGPCGDGFRVGVGS